MDRSIRICIITTNKGAYSETFIRNHIEQLPFEKSILYGGLSVFSDWDTERPLLNPYLERLIDKVAPHSAALLTTKRLASFLKKRKIQLVLAEFGPVGERVLDACLRTKIPLVVHFHGDDAHAERYATQYNEYEQLANHATAAIGVSHPMIDRLASLGFPAEKLHYIPYGIDTAYFSVGNPQIANPHFVAVGRFVDKKAPYLLLLAFSQALKEVPDATLTFIGTGPLWISCKALAKSLQISSQVNFRGVCTPDEVRQCMQQSRAFLMHSITPETGEKEGTPLSILEASASGLPVISTMHAGIPEAVVHGKTGFLVEEGDTKGMAAHIVALAQDPARAKQMGEAGRKHIENQYNLAQQIDKLAQIVEYYSLASMKSF